MNTLAGKHAFVTGASRGIGATIAAALEKAGARVTRVARHEDANVLACDVTSAAAVAAAMTRAEQRHGPIAILVNNAGASASAKFLDTREDTLDVLLDVNLKGAWHCSRRALPAMLAAGAGHIVNIASLAGLDGSPYISAYCVSKHALVGLTRALAAEYAGRGVAIAAVCPGYADTEMLAAVVEDLTAKTGMSAAAMRDRIATLNPDDRILAPEEIAATVLALCLAESTDANGQIISIPSLETSP